MSTKPKWVEALEKAEKLLDEASQVPDPSVVDSKTRMAHAWMDIARLYQASY